MLFDVFQEVLIVLFVSLVNIAKGTQTVYTFTYVISSFLLYQNYYKYFKQLHLTKWNSADLFLWENITKNVPSQVESKPVLVKLIVLLIIHTILVCLDISFTLSADDFLEPKNLDDLQLPFTRFFLKTSVHILFWIYFIRVIIINWPVISVYYPQMIFLIWLTLLLSTTLVLSLEPSHLGVLCFIYLVISRYITNNYLHPIIFLCGASFYVASAAVFFFYVVPSGFNFTEVTLTAWTLIVTLFFSIFAAGWKWYSIYQWRDPTSWVNWIPIVYFLRGCIKWITRCGLLIFIVRFSEIFWVIFFVYLSGVMSYQIEFKVCFSYTVLILLLKDVWLVIYHLVYKDIVNLIKRDLKLWASSHNWRSYQWWTISAILTSVGFVVDLSPVSYITGMIIWNVTFKWRWSKRVESLYAQWNYQSSMLFSILKFTFVLSVLQWLYFNPLSDVDLLGSSPWLLHLRDFLLLPVLPYIEAPRYLVLTIEAFSFIYYRWITPYVSDDSKLAHRWSIYYFYCTLVFLSFTSFCRECL